MTDEQTNKTDTAGTQTPTPVEKPLSIVEEAQKVRDEIRAENDRRETILASEQKLRADELLGGTGGGRVEPVIKEETPKEYAARVMTGKL